MGYNKGRICTVLSFKWVAQIMYKYLLQFSSVPFLTDAVTLLLLHFLSLLLPSVDADTQPLFCPGGHWMQGQICDILSPASYEFLPTLSGHTDSHTLDTYVWGGGRGGTDLRSMSSIRPICKCRCPPPLLFSTFVHVRGRGAFNIRTYVLL